METSKRQRLSTAVDKYTELPLLCLSVAFVPIFVIPLLYEVSPGWEAALFRANLAIWAVFALELLVKTYLAPRRLAYLRSHWLDVVIVVVVVARPLRIVRSARALRAVRLGRLVSVASRASHSVRSVLDQHGLDYILAISLLLMLAGAGAITMAEQDADGNIKNFGDGLWWAVTTVTTVGYGDRFPVTVEGKVVATFLGLLGISLFSLITANVAAFLATRRTANEPTLQELKEQLQRLEDLIQKMQPT